MNRARALRAKPDSRWLSERMVDDVIDRLSFMTIDVKTALVMGDGRAAVRAALTPGAMVTSVDLVDVGGPDLVADEDRLPIAPGSVDLVVASGTLDSIHDLPGALIVIRRALRPGGLFLGAMLGGGSLTSFRNLVRQAEAQENGGGAARFHPQVDVRSAGDLLFRAGFSTPVADLDTVNVRYGTSRQLLADIRATSGNALPHIQPMPVRVGRDLLAHRDIEEQFGVIYLTGWAPTSDEQRPQGPVKGYA